MVFQPSVYFPGELFNLIPPLFLFFLPKGFPLVDLKGLRVEQKSEADLLHRYP